MDGANVAKESSGVVGVILKHTIPFALVPSICWYVGVTRFGWSVAGDPVRLTPDSAAAMCILFFLACVAGVLFLGFMVHWMSSTYGDESSLSKGVRLIFLYGHTVLCGWCHWSLPHSLARYCDWRRDCLPLYLSALHRRDACDGSVTRTGVSLRQRRFCRGFSVVCWAVNRHGAAVGVWSGTRVHILMSLQA